jgi:hypothetical protein
MKAAKPTPQEYAVFAIFASSLFVGLGLLGLSIAYFAPTEKLELSRALAYLSCWSMGIGLFIAAAYQLVRRWSV